MARTKTSYVCQACGALTTKWQGRCEACGEWNTIVEEIVDSGVGAGPKSAIAGGRPIELLPLAGETETAARVETGIGELDRVTGGGFVMGSAVLIGGDPGIGKSTLLLQAAAALAERGRRIVYVSGEEAVAQIRLRAQRLGLGDRAVLLASETNVEIILATLQNGPPPDLVIIDSIQTLWTDRVESAPGTVTQVRTSAQALTRFAKKSGAAVVLVGHVTKDGQIAGPRVVEHLVDAVLYFEGDASHTFRILRGVKNRYGATDEIGVFEMSTLGLREVANPSALFLDQRDKDAAGSAVFAGMEGTRPMLCEVQALGLALAAGHAAARGDRLGFVAAVDGAGGAGNALRGADRRQRYLPQCRGRAEDQRAGGRPRRGGGADLVADRLAAPLIQRLFRRDLAGWRCTAGGPCDRCGCARREKLGFGAVVTGRLGKGGRAQFGPCRWASTRELAELMVSADRGRREAAQAAEPERDSWPRFLLSGEIGPRWRPCLRGLALPKPINGYTGP
jgi:DNA repair protein RadA